MQLKTKKKMSIWRYLTLGYLIVILTGSILLVMPFAAREGHTSYIDALFTATSAACVTGLVPFDTVTHWTLFGQIVILMLIQLGGIGFTTFVSILFIMVKRGFGLYERSAVIKSLGSNSLKGVKTLVKQIVIGTIIFEVIGAGLLSIRFVGDFGPLKGVYYAVFHAVSAFCNAGFDLMGTAQGSLSRYVSDPLVVITVCSLIFIGGLGFCVWGDIFNCKGNPKKFQFYTKFILFCSIILLAVSTGLFLVFDWNVGYADMGWGGKFLGALFDATTARTAGFFTVDYTKMSESGYLLTIILMFIGGCSGSTAGGIKVGTFAVMIMGMLAALRGKQDIDLGKRRVDMSQLHQALAVFTAYLTIILVAVMTICAIEPYSFKQVLFETVSALGTVGLSLSLTPSLSIASKVILILLMYAGRAGVLTIALALGRKNKSEAQIKRPVEMIFIG